LIYTGDGDMSVTSDITNGTRPRFAVEAIQGTTEEKVSAAETGE
jgi:hypothetical protein